MEADLQRQGKHFVLVHGACHGAWCWHKVKPRLEVAGHRVTALDMAASGIDMREIVEVHSLQEYSEPLLEIMAALPPHEKVILVGHSLGGLNLAVAMEKYPEKVSAAVFLTAFMPDTMHKPSYVIDQYVERTPPDAWLDTEFLPYGPETPGNSVCFGPELMSSKLYQRSSIEDLELGLALRRRSSLFLEDLASSKKFSEEKYGSVTRVFIKCDEDAGMSEGFQEWMIENSSGGVKEVMNIVGADHMAMLCKPQELCACLLQVALKYD